MIISFDKWLNDEIINASMSQLQEKSTGKCLFMSTHFYPTQEKCLSNSKFDTTLKNRTRNIFAVETVFVPINIGNTHWTLTMIDMKKKKK